MRHGLNNPRPLAEGMGTAVARRTVFRKMNEDGTYQSKDEIRSNKKFIWENWGQVAKRVAHGNVTIGARKSNASQRVKKLKEVFNLQNHIANGSILLSGRHLQHTDEGTKDRNIEVLSNCSTASTSFMKFYLLLNGSGVGRCYDDNLMLVDWSRQPFVHVALDESHPDFDESWMDSVKSIRHKYGREIKVYTVGDSREGWAQASEYLENTVFEGQSENDVIVFDFSKVRCAGSLIGGMQNRPSAGPVPTMKAFNNVRSLKGCLIPKWKQAMYVDHYFAESVLVGGSRRSARLSVKHWRDPGILEFINLKEPWIIPDVLNLDGTVKTKGRKAVPLWSSNNSIGVDDEFWAEYKIVGSWAWIVYEAACHAAYYHGTGEPGFVNLHKLEVNHEGMDFKRHLGSQRYQIFHAMKLVEKTFEVICSTKWKMIPNPCGEITMFKHGSYCLIGDVVPYHCETLDEAEEAVRLTTRALIRANTLDSVYGEETKRTNRIGVALTGIHEFAWKFFKCSFKDLIADVTPFIAKDATLFWQALARLSNAVRDESVKYAAELGVAVPHTCLTMKPSGTISKLFGLTEGAHLPSMLRYLRWCQFMSSDPLVAKYEKEGYPIRHLKQYKGTSIVGFPTQVAICSLDMGDKLVTATEATIPEQFRWVQLLEFFWLNGGDPEMNKHGNQISYTLKYDPKKISYEDYKQQISDNIQTVRCISVMPTVEDMDESKYEYLPEEPVSLNQYNDYVNKIKAEVEGEDIDSVHLECAGGACPVDINK